jgi:predicted dehydrogenase
MPDVVFVGLSHWHVPIHMKAVLRAGMRIAGGFDDDAALCRDWAGREGATAHPTAEAALASRPDLAIVTGTPLEMPGRLAAALDHGVPVLVEKPIASMTRDIVPLAERARRESRFVAVALPHRHGPIADVPREGIRHFAFRLVNGPPQRYRTWNAAWVIDPEIGGGGALRNLGLHGLDLARSVFGEGLAVTGATFRRWHGLAVEDHAVVHLADAGGRTATVEAGYLHPAEMGSDFEIRVVGADAIVIEAADELRRTGADGVTTRQSLTPLHDRYDILMADLRDRLRDGQRPAADLSDLVAAMTLADAAYARGTTS